MTIRLDRTQARARVADLALELADALEESGEGAAAEAILATSGQSAAIDDRIALRLAERHLTRGDAAAAMEVLVPAWESGSMDPRIESMLALSALALGLDDITLALTDRATSADHQFLRLILGTLRGERVVLNDAPGTAETIWSLRSLLSTLARCGREDLVDRFACDAPDVPGVDRALRGVPRRQAPGGRPPAPPFAETWNHFETHWGLPAPRVAWSWGWAVAREVEPGERVLITGPRPGAFAPLFGHARVTTCAPHRGPGVQIVAEPDALPIAPGRFEHVVVTLWLESAIDLVESATALWRALNHGGSLHLLAAGPALSGQADLILSTPALERLCERARFVVEGSIRRRADGMNTEGRDAVYQLLRAHKRVL
jgi:hypothetical protein